jgi:hypothetical protein
MPFHSSKNREFYKTGNATINGGITLANSAEDDLLEELILAGFTSSLRSETSVYKIGLIIVY